MGKGEGTGNIREQDCKTSLRLSSFSFCLFLSFFFVSSISGCSCCWGASGPFHASTPAHQEPSPYRKVGSFGFIPSFPRAKVYVIPGLLCFGFSFFFHFDPTNASWEGQYISQSTIQLCSWSLQNPRRPPSFSLIITSLLRLQWLEC